MYECIARLVKFASKTRIHGSRGKPPDGYIMTTVSVTTMVANLGLEPLEDRRRTPRLAFLLYKILHEELAVPTTELGITGNTRASRGL